MSDGADGSSSQKRPRQAPDLDKAPLALWLVAIVALASAAAVGYLVFGRDDPTPPSQGAALTIGDAGTVLVTATEVGGGLVEPAGDAEITALTLADADPEDDCADRLTGLGLHAWDPLAGGSDGALARRLLVDGAGASLSQEVGPWSADDLGDVRDAIADCPELALAGEAGAGTAQLSVRDAATDLGDDTLVVETVITTDGTATTRSATAEVWVRDGLHSTLARSTPAGADGAAPVDDARLELLAAASDARLEAALEEVS